MGIANIINNSTTTSGGEIVRELVNSSDGQGLHFDGAAGNIDIASPPKLGTKFSFEFVIKADSWTTNPKQIFLTDFGSSGRFVFGTGNFASGGINGNLGVYSGGWSNHDFGVKVLDDLKVHHLVLTVDGTSATLYDNGNQVGTATIVLPTLDSAGDLAIGSAYNSASTYSFNGTIYRARFWNKTLEPDEVQTAFERADVDFADQYGNASNQVTNGNFETNTSGWTSENTSTFQRNTTSPISGTGDLEWTGDGSGYPGAISNSFSLTAGKKYRIKFTYRVTSGTVYLKFGKTAGATSAAVAGISEVSLTASSNTAYEATVTPTESTTAYIVFRGNNNTTPTMFVDLVDFVQIGAAVDLDLAFANPAQSLMVQDRSGAADGTCSASGVTQVQPVVQLNSTSARIGTVASAVADGSLAIGDKQADAHSDANELIIATSAGNAGLTINSANNAGGMIYFADGTSGADLYRGYMLYSHTTNAMSFGTNATTHLTIASTGLATFTNGITVSGGNVQVGASAAAVSSGKLMSYFDGNIGNGLQIHDINTGAGTGHLAAIFTRNTSVIGSISTTASATAFNTSSDYRLKENLTPLTGALDRLDALPVYRFNFKADPDTTVDGFVAHEVSEHVPEAITGEKDAMRTVVVQEAVEAVEAKPATYWEEGDELPEGVAVGDEKTPAVEAVEAVAEVTEEQPDYQGIDQSKLVPLLVACIKELKSKVETLENA